MITSTSHSDEVLRPQRHESGLVFVTGLLVTAHRVFLGREL